MFILNRVNIHRYDAIRYEAKILLFFDEEVHDDLRSQNLTIDGESLLCIRLRIPELTIFNVV